MNQYLPDLQPSKSRFVRLGLATKCRHLSVIRFLVLPHISGACTRVQRYRVCWNSLAIWRTLVRHGPLHRSMDCCKAASRVRRMSFSPTVSYELGVKIIAKTGDV